MRLFLSAMSILMSIPAFAHSAGSSEATYYVGEQKVGIAGDTVPCYVEADFSEDGLSATVRSLVADSHDTDELFGLGPVVAQYNESAQVYVYSNQEPGAEVIDFLLVATQEKSAEKMNVMYLHVDHPHMLSCDRLVALEGAELVNIEEKFEHFEDYTGEHHHEEEQGAEGDHDHDDDRNHDHDHDHE